MAEFASDNATATLSHLEEGALRALATLGSSVSVDDLTEFCVGFCAVDPSWLTRSDIRNALMALDALGWAAPSPDYAPLTADAWRITEQGSIALEGRTP